MAKTATIDFDSTRPPSPFLNEGHAAWRRELRRFIEREIMPFVDAWEEAGEIPLELYRKASEFGLRRMGYPEQYGGISEGTDRFFGLVTSEEMARIGAGGVGASLMVHGIGLPPILAMGSEGDEAGSRTARARGRQAHFARHHRALRRLRRPRSSRRARAATATTTSSTAPRCSSPAACARTGSPPPCARAARAWAASRCC